MKKTTKFALYLLTAAMIALPALTGCSNNSGTSSQYSTASTSDSSAVSDTAESSDQESSSYKYRIVLATPDGTADEARSNANELLAKRMIISGFDDKEIHCENENIIISYNTDSSETPEETAKALIKKGYVVFRSGTEQDGEALLDSSDIQTAEAFLDGSTDTKQYAVKIIFKDESKDKLKTATENNMNNTISVWVDDQLIASPVVNDVISNGELVLFSGTPYTEEEAARLAGNICCVIPLELTIVSAETI